MPKVYTYVQATDGLFYKNPILEHVGVGFLCFNDEEPPELVVSATSQGQAARKINNLIKTFGLDCTKLYKSPRKCGERAFGRVAGRDPKLGLTGLQFSEAYNIEIELKARISALHISEHFGSTQSTRGLGTYYAFPWNWR